LFVGQPLPPIEVRYQLRLDSKVQSFEKIVTNLAANFDRDQPRRKSRSAATVFGFRSQFPSFVIRGSRRVAELGVVFDPF
jgi:hypothetical protein